MKVQIQKWGNSLALRIPHSFAVDSNVAQGTTVDVSLANGTIVVKPVIEPEFSLEELLAKVTKSNIHSEEQFGSPVGKETL